MISYRVQYDAVKPGGTVVHEDESVYGGEKGLMEFLAKRNPQGAYCLVTEHTKSDGNGVDATDEYGWR